MSVEEVGKKAKKASTILRMSKAEDRIAALEKIAKNLLNRTEDIIEANQKDITKARQDGLSEAMIDRLLLNPERIHQMSAAVKEVAAQDEVAGKIISTHQRSDGLIIKKQMIPLGVLAMIFESRPNVVIDCSAIAIKSSNAIILKGGKEAYHSNKILGEIVQNSIDGLIPRESVQVLDSFDRQTVEGLLTLNQYVDVIIPRGGEKLIEYVYQNATVPVIAHFKGLCHLYIHQDAKLQDAIKISLNAKTQRPGVCNAIETLLVHRDLPDNFLQELFDKLNQAGIELRLDPSLYKKFPQFHQATNLDWDTEYLDKILSIKSVANENEAIAHIGEHGTHHTEGIIASDPKTIELFLNAVDASCIVINSSTRFNDGGQLGLGAELGISTSKLHAYGPMGVSELMTTRYVVEGSGHIRN